MQDYSALLLLALIGVPVGLLVLYLRKPYDAQSVPRDGMASRGKAKLPRTLGVVPNQALDDKIIDQAADQSDSEHPG
jgi:hypothetical protein